MRKLLSSGARRVIGPIERLARRKYHVFPFGTEPQATADRYLELWEEGKAASFPDVDAYEEEIGYRIDPDWFHGLALQTQIVVKSWDTCYQHGRLLYTTLSEYIAGHTHTSLNVLETGTARGFSSLCMAKALSDAGMPGTILTFDVLPHDVKMYWNCIADVEGVKTRAELLAEYAPLIENYIIFHEGDTTRELPKVKIPRVHFAFLDGKHTYEAVLHEFACIQRQQRAGDVIFFDDYTPDFFPGIVQAVDEICRDNGYSKRTLTISNERGYAIAKKL